MHLEKLEIRRLPGISPGFVLRDLGDGVHFLTGPNAVGKSSVVRAVGYLLRDPQPSDPLELWLEARFRGSPGTFEVRRVGGAVEWRKEGQRVERPPLAAPDEIIYYELAMEHLLSAEADHRFLHEVHRQLRGGFDLATLRGEEPFAPPKQPGRHAARRLREATRRLREVERAYAELARREMELPRLQAEVSALRETAERLPLLERALECLATRVRRRELEARLHRYPAVLERLRGDELEVLQGLRDQRRQLLGSLEQLEGRRRAAEDNLRQSGLADARPTETDLESARATLEELQRWSDQLEQAHRELHQAESELAIARRHLGAADELPRLDPEKWEQAREWAIYWDELNRERKRLEGEAEVPPDAPGDQMLRALDQGEAILLAWQEAAHGWRPWRFRLPLGVVAVSGLLTAVTAWTTDLPQLAILGLAALAGGLWLWLQRESAGPQVWQRRWPGDVLEPPAAWSPGEVRRRLDQLRARRRELEELWRLQERARFARERLKLLEREVQAHRQRGEELREVLGFDPAKTLNLVTWASLLTKYRDAWVAWEQARRRVAGLEARLDEGVAALRQFVARWGERAEDTREPAALRVCYASLHRRWKAAEEAERQLRESVRRQAELQEQLARLGQEERELFARAGLQAGQDEELADLCRRLVEWRMLKEEHLQVAGAEAELAARLADTPEIRRLVESADQVRLEQLRDEAQAARRALEERQAAVVRLQEELRTAGGDLRLEEAFFAVDRARRELEDERDAAVRAEAAQFLLDEIDAEYRAEHEPAVLKAAQSYFAKFTRHAYVLDFDPGAQEILAVETRLGGRPRRRLEELSTATRMQLLLALRLAWIARIEQGREALPLFLDEALTTTDPDRFAALAQSLQSLADEGRQVFYLTARPEELLWWERATGRQPHHLDLAAVRFPAAGREPRRYRLPEPPEIPPPGDLSPEQYAVRLGVPAWDPEQGWEALPLFYLLRDDLHLLYRLLHQWGLRTWGQVRQMLETEAAEILTEEERRELLLRSRVAESWVTAWRQGRAAPVTVAELQASGAVSPRFLEPLTALAAQVGGDATRLLAALQSGQVKGFRRNKIDELATWLEEHGYLPRDRILTPAERRLRVFQEVGSPRPEIGRLIQWLEAAAS